MLNIGDTVYDIRNINNLDITERYIQKGVITSANESFYYITHSDNSVREVPILYIVSQSFIEDL